MKLLPSSKEDVFLFFMWAKDFSTNQIDILIFKPKFSNFVKGLSRVFAILPFPVSRDVFTHKS